MVRALADAGIGCGVLMAPVIPFLAGATSVTPLVPQLPEPALL
ncbi:hypothetical protein ABZ646_44960 [Streptomyces sp. NPDC007162]